jgi:uncharacterized LabA/DUF88 family protein
MKVALFFDGKSFYRAMSDFDSGIQLDYESLTEWVTNQIGGREAVFAGAYYYTGIYPEPGGGAFSLGRFLEQLEYRRGFFVRREPKVDRLQTCHACGVTIPYKTEKRVDTRLVAEMIQLAAVDAFDVAVLFSGDQDLIPAVEALGALGKQVYVGTWQRRGLSRELRVRCFGELDLAEGVDSFSTRQSVNERVAEGSLPAGEEGDSPQVEPTASTSEKNSPVVSDPAGGNGSHELELILKEIDSARDSFPNGYLSRWYFVNRWRPALPIPRSGKQREAAVDQLISEGRLEQYMVSDEQGRPTAAIRRSS